MEIFKSKGAGSLTINGRSFSGNCIVIGNNGKITIDGVEEADALIGDISITINGNSQSVETTSGNITILGAAGSVKTMSGDVECGDVSGPVNTMSGDVHCKKVEGSVKTMSGKIYFK